MDLKLQEDQNSILFYLIYIDCTRGFNIIFYFIIKKLITILVSEFGGMFYLVPEI